ncbi:MFS transporter [Arthrobacter ginkgonis]|uniref:MFS transporter n=1 Tax=Arthrobacter ginkgonis TaxID=1630594 RepID=A0ABP7C3M3_9MICC
MTLSGSIPVRPAIHSFTPRDVKIASWICFFAWTVAVYDFVLFGNLLPIMAEDLGLSAAGATGLNTWITAGTALVAFGIGPVVDRYGRRRGIILAVVGAAVASLLTATVGWMVGLLGGLGLVGLVLIRSLAGLGYAEQAINAVYLNEVYSSSGATSAQLRRRGLVYSLVQSGWPVGAVLAAASTAVLQPVGGWELCFVAAAVPAAFIGFAARWLKESPQFSARTEVIKLNEAGRHDEAAQLAEEFHIDDQGGVRTPIRDTFRGESLRPVLAIGLAFLMNWIGVLVFAILGTSLLTAESGRAVPFTNALLILIVSNGSSFLGYLFHGWLGDRIGRRNTIAIGWTLSAASFTGMLMLPAGSFAATVALYSLGLFFLIGPFSALLFFNGESFPAATRATAGSIINAAGQVGAIVGGVIVTACLGFGMSWNTTALFVGCIPILASGLMVLAAPHRDPAAVRLD